jgi:hypothetical protein
VNRDGYVGVTNAPARTSEETSADGRGDGDAAGLERARGDQDRGVDVDEDLAFRAETAPVIVLTGLAGVKRES